MTNRPITQKLNLLSNYLLTHMQIIQVTISLLHYNNIIINQLVIKEKYKNIVNTY